MFMHNGQIGGFTQLRRHLTALLSDECFDALQGGTDSELLFQLMMTNGLREDTESAIRRSIVQVEKMRQEAGIAEAFRATFAITDGKHVWALRWSSDDYAPSLYLTQKHDGALIVSEPLDKDTLSWQKVPPDTLVRIAIEANEVTVARHEAFL